MDIESQQQLYYHEQRRRRLALFMTMIVVQMTYYYQLLFLSKAEKIPYHTSILTGEGWILELMNGHPDRIKTSLGVSHDVFDALVLVLEEHGFIRSQKGISVAQQLGIFLYTCVTGLSSRHVGERFQHSPDTITSYFKEILIFFSSRPFYTNYVQQPKRTTPISLKITSDPRFRHFSDCIGAIDGTHIHAFVPFEEHVHMRNRKGFLSQNCLFACDFDFRFTYAMTGMDGSTPDAVLWHEAHKDNLRIPPGRYLLADAGFGSSDALLVPYRGVRYHLKEWRQAQLRPQNKKELFNLRHAVLRNIIERIFGVLKRKWRILQLTPEYNMKIQSRIPAALCAIHNFIQDLDPETFFEPEFEARRLAQMDEEDDATLFGELGEGPASAGERHRSEERRDQIAELMWTDYNNELRRLGYV